MKIRLSKIDDVTFNVREKLDREFFNELKESLKEDGQWDPIIVRPHGEKYEVIAGHRRVQAALELGWSEIEATIRDVDDSEALFLALKTNLIRQDMTEREQGKVLHRIKQEFGITQKELAKRLGKSHTWVDRRIRMALDLSEGVANALESKKVSMTVAEVIASLARSVQDDFLKHVIEKGISGDADAVRKVKRRFLNDTLYTIGYEGKNIGDFISILKHNNIEYLIDIRYSNESQYKPEFNGTILARELERNGMKYVYKSEYGVPYEWQNPYKEGAIPFECLDKYYRWRVKKNNEFQKFLDYVKESGKTALMCYEQYATPKREQKIACHRNILSTIMKETGEFQEVVNL